jgi:hypothetical protein
MPWARVQPEVQREARSGAITRPPVRALGALRGYRVAELAGIGLANRIANGAIVLRMGLAELMTSYGSGSALLAFVGEAVRRLRSDTAVMHSHARLGLARRTSFPSVSIRC